MATRRKVGNLLALAVLSYLTRQSMHPYELGRTLTLGSLAVLALALVASLAARRMRHE